MDDSSDEDFMNLPGPSTQARVERKEWPAKDDPVGTSSKKVGGGSGRAPKEEKTKENMSKEEKKREASRIRMAKMRANRTEERRKADQEADRICKAKQRERLGVSDEKKEALRIKMSERRSAMTLEEKEEIKAKDRERKAKKAAMKEKSSKKEEEPKKYYDDRDSNMMYKRKIRENQSKEVKELRKIEHVIQMRKHRAARTEEKIDIDRRLAKEEMKHMRKYGKIPTHCSEVSKYTANVPRKRRQRDENEMWKNYCKENPEQKNLFETLKPNSAMQLKMLEEEEKEERRLLDEKKKEEEEKTENDGYWHYMPDIDDYMWVGSGPAPDCSDANEPGMCDNPWNLTEEQLEEERRQIKEENEAYLEWALMERRKANAESAKKHREKVKAKLQVPVEEMPDYEMSEYELMRQKNIEEMEKMKKAIGLFDD